MQPSNYSITNALFCDDYRVEQSGKGIIVGLYQNSAAFDEYPAKFRFVVLMVGTATGDFEVSIKVRFEPDSVSENVEIEKNARAEIHKEIDGEPIRLFMPMPALEFNLSGPGEISVWIRTKKKRARWNKIGHLDILTSDEIEE